MAQSKATTMTSPSEAAPHERLATRLFDAVSEAVEGVLAAQGAAGLDLASEDSQRALLMALGGTGALFVLVARQSGLDVDAAKQWFADGFNAKLSRGQLINLVSGGDA